MTVSHAIVILLTLTCQLTPKSNSHISLLLLRLYINYSIFNAIHFSPASCTVQQCIQISTRINSSSVHTYIFVCSTLRVNLQGFVTQNATWCQNRGCICISSTRRTYGRIHMLPVIQTRTIILCTELFPKKRREKIQGEILQSTFEYSGVSTFLQDSFEYSVFYSVLHAIQQLQVILHTELILPQEILQLQGSSRAGSFQQLFPVSPSILHGRIRLPDLPTAFQGHTAQAGFQ